MDFGEENLIHGGDLYDKKTEYDLSVNLNPNPCPSVIRTSLERALGNVGHYPDILQRDFTEAVAEAENKLLKGPFLTRENVLGGNGASELIFAIIRLISPKKVMLPVPGFYGYRHGLMALKDVNIIEYPLEEDKDFLLTEDFASKISDDTDLIILTNPNNPTGRTISPGVMDIILEKCKKTGTAVLIDECFLHLSEGAESTVRYINDVSNLFVVNAYTKLFGIPGVRIGYCMASSENITRLKNFLPEWNMSVFALEAGYACAKHILDTDYVAESVGLISHQRQELTAFLESKKIKVYPSDTCFVLVRSEKDLYDYLLNKKVLIRDCSNFSGLAKGFYRIAVSGSSILIDYLS